MQVHVCVCVQVGGTTYYACNNWFEKTGAKHAGSGGIPPGKFLKIDAEILQFRDIST